MTTVKSPFPYFGGKRRIARQVWQRLGNVSAYVEPFAGSLAVLLANPKEYGCIETVNDVDCLVANFWRSISLFPAKVLEYVQAPWSEKEFNSRCKFIFGKDLTRLGTMLEGSIDGCDPQLAGMWAWCVCMDIAGPLFMKGRPRMHTGRGQGFMSKSGRLNPAKMVDGLHQRLKDVRVLCRDWRDALAPACTTFHGVSGIFFDPPYGVEDRKCCYRIDSREIAGDVRKWCIEHDRDQNMRIALCGYEGEHNALEDRGWTKESWVAGNCMGREKDGNGTRERIWFSPSCLGQQSLPGLD